MNEADVARVAVRILDKEFFVACPADERDDLLQSAAYLNGKMREIRDTGKVVGLDRIAVIAALNMANELVKLHARDAQLTTGVGDRLRRLGERVEAALESGRQPDL